MIADQASIDHYGEIDAFDNLEELLPKDLYAKVEPFIYQAVRSDGTAVPAAISLESTRFSQVSGVTINPPYLAVVSGSPRKEAAVEDVYKRQALACVKFLGTAVVLGVTGDLTINCLLYTSRCV